MIRRRPQESSFKLLLLTTLIVLDVSSGGVPWVKSSNSKSSSSSSSSLSLSSTLASAVWRGGAFGRNSGNDYKEMDSRLDAYLPSSAEQKRNHNSATIEAYVAAMKKKDHQDTYDSEVQKENLVEAEDSSPDASSSIVLNETSDIESRPQQEASKMNVDDIRDDSVVGVKSHTHKKSNAVGDPDGDDDDDDDESLSEYSEEWEELDELVEEFLDDVSVEPEVKVQVELVEEGTDDDEDDDIEMDVSDSSSDSVNNGGGGVGVRLSRMSRRRKNRRKDAWKSSEYKLSDEQATLLGAWSQFIFFPPATSALAYLSDNARLMDSFSKSRLDRRTLYAGLMLEWGATDTKFVSSTRKFLDASTSRSLQAALSLASQPQWRKAAPRTNAVRLYQEDESSGGCTLSMQETIAMALAHSLGCGMLIIDDHVINKVRQLMASQGLSDDAMKPASLIQSLLSFANNGQLKPTPNAGSISACMKRDLLLGLDDPYDDRASISCDDMVRWEETWNTDWVNKASSKSVDESKPLPLILFIRTDASTNLLKSKSAMELLIQECTSSESIHMIALGKEIDITATSDAFTESQQLQANSPRRLQNSNPYFGFSSQNQNASGQNDPEGSRRFNIFLAKSLDEHGQPVILGCIAPPAAGNLFPHMMAMQARERLNNQSEDSPQRGELVRWAQMLQSHMDANESTGMSTPPPQFFNASLGIQTMGNEDGESSATLPPEKIEQVLQDAMSEMLDRLAQMSDDPDASPSDIPQDLQKAFALILRNENIRHGIGENLRRAAAALSDPKCTGIMLSVYVPPPPSHWNRGKAPESANEAGGRPTNNMGGWFQKILNSQEDNIQDGMDGDSEMKNKQKRVRTMAAAAAVMAANKAKTTNSSEKSGESKAARNLAKLESICRPIPLSTPMDPVRAKEWGSWILREVGAVNFQTNRKALNEELVSRNLTLQLYTGTHGAGSALRQMLSVRSIASEMEDVIKCAVELEAAKSQRLGESSAEMHQNEMTLEMDASLSQLILDKEGSDSAVVREKDISKTGSQYIHPSSLETALSIECHMSPSPSGWLSVSNTATSHRTKEEIMSLAQDKHERALIPQVVSPQDIGVTYDMIGGLSDVKELLRQSITYPLKFPHLYSEGIAREAVKGVLLFGPPGTGKTMLAKAVATEGGASFLSVDASSVENKWLGESEKNAKAVFTLARRLAPCVVFIDEVDSLLSSREGSSDDSAHGTLTSVKTTMMSEWDGLNSGTNGSGERVIVIGSTNRPFDLDDAVLRRFPRRILVDLPDLETRKEILEVTLAENRLDHGVNLTLVAERLEGYTGSDIKEVCRETVVQISHEQARLLDQGLANSRADVTKGSLQRLRPVTMSDFENTLGKLKKSVSEKGKELLRVWEWNDEYGEIKKDKNHRPQLMNMYL